MEEFDLVVIGAGPAGYTGAIRATQLGMRVACIEQKKTLGGTCLNVGCIPSKALLNYSEKFEEAGSHFMDMGINANPKLDLKKMLQKKDKVVDDLCKGIEGLFAKNKIKRFQGVGKIIDNNIVEITENKKSEKIKAKNILIATGSEVTHIPSVKIDEERIITSTGALGLKQVPKEMVVSGGGYIGLELGSVWRRLGSKVTVVEYADRIVPALDKEVGKNFTKILQKQGLEFMLSTKLITAKRNKDKVELELEINGKKEKKIVDVALISVGRRPNSEGLGIDKIGIELDQQGRIKINNNFQTNKPNIFAVGDIVDGPMLAHKAEEEAVAAVEIMAGHNSSVNYHLIPSVVYTWPEVATIGFTEEELKEEAIDFKVGKFPFLANSRARSIDQTDGFVKILACAKTDKILGAHILGPNAGDLIAEIVAYMKNGSTSMDICHTCHAHPTLSEAVKEAALAVHKRTINM